jgi:predicted transcriptional regulator
MISVGDMKMKKDIRITDTELEVMKLVWKKNGSIASSEIISALRLSQCWKNTTIYTLISRLVEKGFLIQSKANIGSSYTPAISEKEYALEQTHSFVNKVFGGDAKQLVSMLCESNKINAEEINELRNFWEENNSNE